MVCWPVSKSCESWKSSTPMQRSFKAPVGMFIVCWTMYSRNSLHRLLVRNAELSTRRLSSARTSCSRDSVSPLLSLSHIPVPSAHNNTTHLDGGRGFLTARLTVSRAGWQAFLRDRNDKIPLALIGRPRTKPSARWTPPLRYRRSDGYPFPTSNPRHSTHHPARF